MGGTVKAFNFVRRVAFPSTPSVLTIFATVSVGTSVISLLIATKNISQTLVFAVAVLFSPGVLGEIVNSKLILRKDRILDFRRLMGIEIISSTETGGILVLSSVIGVLLGVEGLWKYGLLIGASVSLPLRFLTPIAMSSTVMWRKIAAGLPTTLITVITYLSLIPFLSPSSNPSFFKISFLIGSMAILSVGGTLLIIRRVEIEGSAEIHYSPMSLFRAFLDHWLRKTPETLEEHLLFLSTEGSIETKILSFSASDSQPKAGIVVSNFHPGPYRDMGSGGLASELKHSLEQAHQGIVQVPHGISNHKLNIVSHKDIDVLLSAAVRNYPSDYPIRGASSMIREREGEAIVSGQAFGRVAVLTITLAPEEMEDLPTTVSIEIERAASRLGFEVLIIDAHNSLLGQTSIKSDQAERIIKAAVKLLDRIALLPQYPFQVGSSFDPLDGYGLKDGIGPGGMSALTVRCNSNMYTYLTIDGNNMQQGLRGQIIESIQTLGVSDAEIMTTDTHLVTGIVRSPLGYYPVGAVLPTPWFLARIGKIVSNAIGTLEDSSGGISKFSLSLRVLGSEAFNSISGFIGRIARQIGRSYLWLEISTLLASIIILILV